MLAVDTNVLVRAVLNDDPVQSERARECLRNNTVFIADTVLLETDWVLRRAGRLPRHEVIAVLERIVMMPNVELRDRPIVDAAFDLMKAGLDFADALHVACTPDGATFVTFDRLLLRDAAAVGTAVTSP